MEMSIVPTSTSSRGRAELKIEHGGRELFWDVGCFDKRCLSGSYDLCKHINGYWARMLPARQEKVFGIFQTIRTIFEDGSSTSAMINDLLPQIAALFEEHSLDEVGHYIAFYASDIVTPTTFMDAYTPNEDRPSTREKTYTKPDYQQLVTLALALRVMIPIWGEFIHRTWSETGTNFKEYHAYKLLSQTKIVHSPPMEKLKVYVENNIKSDKSMASAIVGGVGSEDYSEWLLALVLVRRLCIGDISGYASGDAQLTNLVTFIYNFIIYKVSGNTSTSFGEMIRNKEFESGESSNEHNASRIENYKIKQESPIGDMVILDHYMEDPLQVALQLKPDMDVALLNELLTAADQLQTEQLWSGQIILTQWVLASVLSPRGIVHLSKKKTISAIAVAQTWLWERGHFELACLISSIASNNKDQLQLGGNDSRARIPKDMMEQLLQLYPFTKVSSAKQRTKPANAAVEAIDSVASLLGARDWILTVPDAMAAKVTGNQSLRRYSCPYDIRYLLAKLSIELATMPRHSAV